MTRLRQDSPYRSDTKQNFRFIRFLPRPQTVKGLYRALQRNFRLQCLSNVSQSMIGISNTSTAISSLLFDFAPKIWCLQAAKKLHKFMLHRILQSPMKFFDQTPVGRIVSRFSKDIDVVDNQLPQQFYTLCFCFWRVN
jgi:ABC-type multidrug transport system fused ATPase/permease subunit